MRKKIISIDYLKDVEYYDNEPAYEDIHSRYNDEDTPLMHEHNEAVIARKNPPLRTCPPCLERIGLSPDEVRRLTKGMNP